MLIQKIIEQIMLVFSSVSTAVVLGIVLGVMVRTFRYGRIVLLGGVNIIQTVPSLALLAMLLPIFGIGFTPAFIALSLYAILPILRNTLVGLSEVSPAIMEAGRDLGASSFQSLIKIELPLAMPMIIAGIRTAIAMTVGIATIAAFIGAGGLGDYITRGLAMNDNALLLKGAIPAALMALGLDGLFSLLQNKTMQKKNYATLFMVIAVMSGFLISYTFYQKAYFKKQNVITIGSKNFTEQNILAEITAQLIESKTNLTVIRKFNLGTTDICTRALTAGEIDLYPEYTGTAFMTVLHQQYSHQTPLEIYNTVKHYYLNKYHVIWFQPLGFENSQALAVTTNFLRYHHVKTLSDLQKISTELTLGAPPEFLERSDGYALLKKTYQMDFKKIVTLDPSIAILALIKNNVDVILTFTTDPRILKYNLSLLKDDKKSFPPYEAAWLINQTVLSQYPELNQVLNLLAHKITTEAMRQLNSQVEVEKIPQEKVAHDFLLAQRLTK